MGREAEAVAPLARTERLATERPRAHRNSSIETARLMPAIRSSGLFGLTSMPASPAPIRKRASSPRF